MAEAQIDPSNHPKLKYRSTPGRTGIVVKSTIEGPRIYGTCTKGKEKGSAGQLYDLFELYNAELRSTSSMSIVEDYYRFQKFNVIDLVNAHNEPERPLQFILLRTPRHPSGLYYNHNTIIGASDLDLRSFIRFIMDSDGHHPHVVRFANPVFTIVDMSNPSWSSEQSTGKGLLLKVLFIDSNAWLESMEHRGWAADRGPPDESEHLDFGLGSPPCCQGSERFVSHIDRSEPLEFGLDPLPILQESEHFVVDNDGSSYDFGLPLNSEGVDKMYDQGLLDFGIPRSPPGICNDDLVVSPTHTSGECVESSFATANSALLASSQYSTLPSLFPVINHFNREYPNEEVRSSNSHSTRPDYLIHAAAALHEGSRMSSSLENFHTPLSDGELLKMCHSMRLGVLSEDEFEYARRLLTDVAEGDNERDIVPFTLRDIVEAERPLHVAYSQATTTFRKRVQDLQRAVRLHNHTQQLRNQPWRFMAATDVLKC
ncbi:hypothetical protein BDR07DRAFT_1374423 [Suillus spraguei]|nr:hypothetical protein BDR07DRAFT_1374423 [Suillus spraguei]